MATASLTELFHNLLRASIVRDAGPTDAQLLDIFIGHRDDMAFEALVRRHGPMVLGACNRILRNSHDAEDAFQATFLVLACKARTIRPRRMVAGWLYGVACNTAQKLRRMNARRRVKERESVAMSRPEAAQEIWRQFEPVLDEELRGLPDKFRVPIVLCDLEGKSRKEAARQLGWPEGTVASRLARARQFLAKRLARHGLVLSASAMASAISENQAVASMPNGLVVALTKAAPLVAAGKAAAGILSARVTALTHGVLTAMFATKLKIATGALVVLGILMSGAGYYSSEASPQTGATFGTQTGEPAKKAGSDKPATKSIIPGQPAAKLDLSDVIVDEINLLTKTISVTIGDGQASGTSTNSSNTSSSTASATGATSSKSTGSTTSTSSSAGAEMPTKLVHVPFSKEARVTVDGKNDTIGNLKTGMNASLQLAMDGKRLVVISVSAQKVSPHYLRRLANSLLISKLHQVEFSATVAANLQALKIAEENLAKAQDGDAKNKAQLVLNAMQSFLRMEQAKLAEFEEQTGRLQRELDHITESNKKK